MSRAARQDLAPTVPPSSQPGLVPGWAVVSAALAPVVGISGWLAAGALQPASYSPLRQTVSVMAGLGGTDRWVMTWALFAVGGAEFVTAAALTALRPPARVLLLIAGVCSIGIAWFPEPAGGSAPPHIAFTAAGAVSLAVWPAFTAVAAAPRPALLRPVAAATVTAVFLVLLAWLVIQTQGGGELGLAERLTSSLESCWPFAVALSLRCASRRAARAGPDVPADEQLAAGGSRR